MLCFFLGGNRCLYVLRRAAAVEGAVPGDRHRVLGGVAGVCVLEGFVRFHD